MYLRIPDIVRYPGLIKYDYRMMSNSSLMQVDKNDNVVTKKMSELMKWYEQVTGLNEVHAAQKRVLEEEKKLASAQEHRREVNKMVNAIQNKLRELHTELDNTPRGDDKYVHLITQEHRLLKEERQLASELQQYERDERDYFTALSSAVKESHEKERAQAERTKYWSIIGSIIGTVIGIAGSSLNNHFKLKKFENLVKESLASSPKVDPGNIPQLLHKQEQQLSQIVAEIRSLSVLPNRNPVSHKVSETGSTDKIDKMLRLLDQQQVVLQNKFKELEVLIKNLAVSSAKVPTSQSELVSKHSLGADTESSLVSSYGEYAQNHLHGVVGVGILVFVVAVLCSYCR